jgi:mono/diheme cytochrome c family protein
MVDPKTGALDRKLAVAGGAVYDERHGVPGKVPVPNITPDDETGLGRWTDGEILRAIREGISKDGHALWPMMPYGSCFRYLSDDDGFAIVAYMRTLAPVRNVVPPRDLDFPVGLVVKTIPEPLEGPVAGPGPSPKERGEYLVRVAGCAECHTARDDRGTPLPGMTLAGGNDLRLLDLRPGDPPIRMPNLTPDQETGIGKWSDDELRRAIRDGVRPDGTKLAEQGPAAIFHDLRDEDVDAIIAYLRSVPAVHNPKAMRK